MISLNFVANQLVIEFESGDLAPRQESQLVFWGFELDADNNKFLSTQDNIGSLLKRVVSYLERSHCKYHVASRVKTLLAKQEAVASALADALAKGKRLKGGSIDTTKAQDFLDYLAKYVPRELKEHQYKAALHLLSVKNGANFSVPGSGKTTVVLTVFNLLRLSGQVDSLFVVCPPAAFGPWRMEYQEVLGVQPSYEMLAGGDIEQRHGKYLVNKQNAKDLYLTTFQTLQNDLEKVRILFTHQGINFFLVVDEAHYIKQIDGAWAKAVLNVARYAERRVILTGTPFPRSYTDAYNLFDILWPEYPPIPTKMKHEIELKVQKGDCDGAGEILDSAIGPLFYRVRKAELGLAPQRFHPPISVEMNKYERYLYDSILDRIRAASQSDYFKNLELLIKLRRGRMIRLRQCISYATLLCSAISGYTEDLIDNDVSLTGIIQHYGDLENPGKSATTGIAGGMRKAPKRGH